MPEHIARFEQIALDMVRLEWAEIEAFDEAAKPALTKAEVVGLGPDSKFELQPHVRLLDLNYPVDNLLIRVRSELEEADIVSNAVTERVRSSARRARLPNPERIFLAVHRADNSVYFKRIDKEAYAILRALRDGETLSDAVEAVDWSNRPPEEASAEVQQWFAYWSAQGWFCKKEPNAPDGHFDPSYAQQRLRVACALRKLAAIRISSICSRLLGMAIRGRWLGQTA
jgi:hypothetical protein